MPELPYTEKEMLELAKDVIKSHISVTGVQAKLSIDIERHLDGRKKLSEDHASRFTIVGLWGGYILKPPTGMYALLPQVEDLTMHLADITGIQAVPHSLIRLKEGSLAYITKRIDRQKTIKLHMEDMCQLTERLTEDKYRGSYEQICKAILKYSARPGLDALNFYEQVLFSFLTGNADMQLKNFSLINMPGSGYTLAPAYDMVASALLIKEDNEDLALTLNGKKRKLTRADFDKVFLSERIVDSRSIDNLYLKFQKALPAWRSFIDTSFLPAEMKEEYWQIVTERAKRIQLV